MRGIFWMGVGVTVTVLVIRKSKQLRAKYSPPAIVHRVLDDVAERTDKVSGRVVSATRGFTADFTTAMTRRENQLRGAMLSDGQRDPVDVRAERAAKEQEFSSASGRFSDEEDDDLPYSF